MLKDLLRDNTGFIAQERVFGALFKANIRELDESVFSTKGINKLVSHLGITFGGILYCRPRMDTPCLYGACTILGDKVAVESALSWKELKRIQRQEGGVFCIYIEIQKETSFNPRLVVYFEVEKASISSIKLSPVLDLIKVEQTKITE
ncbi:hypothetical protein DDO73_17080 [Vibrio cholerae]|nr:hypothetical protein [Vibrio cholerae]HDI3136560.1 hypothetical protein [Vibrio cholerae]